MSDIGKKRTLLFSVAAAAIIVGLLFLGGMPGGGEAAVSPSPVPAAAVTTGENGSPPDHFEVRDYSEFSKGIGADLPSSDWLGLLTDMALKLILVIALIYLVAKLLKRYVYRKRPEGMARKTVSVLSSTNLTPNRTVYILEVGRKMLVVGATPGQMSLLTEVTDPEAIEEVRLLSAENPPADQFGSIMGAFMRRWGDQDTSVSSNPLAESLQARVREGRDFVQGKIAEVRKSLGRD